MRSTTKIFAVLIFLLTASIYAQIGRVGSMGNLSIAIQDRDESMNIYDFAGNPAWLVKDELSTRLTFTPSISNSWGDYRLKYSPEGASNYTAGFIGIKPLGSSGTFLGQAVYDYNLRRNNYRSLVRDTYTGEGFYFTDTTSGNVVYKGPVFQFMHSLELLERLYFGASISYQINGGLKEKYSYLESTYRNVNGQAGIAYELTDGLVLGADFKIFDSQEQIECTDINQYTILSYNYRGELYSIQDFKSTVNHKIRKHGTEWGTQAAWHYSDDGAVILSCNYGLSNTHIYIPKSMLINNEEGYASFQNYSFRLKSQYQLTNDLLLGFYSSYSNDHCWSKISSNNLKMWEWELKEFSVGTGASYKILPALLVAAEYQFSNTHADSSKYIDRVFRNLKSNNHAVRIGAEYELKDQLFLRAGFNYKTMQHDFVYGGDDCKLNAFTGGVGFPLFDIMNVNAYVQYVTLSPGKPANVSRNFMAGNISIELNTF